MARKKPTAEDFEERQERSEKIRKYLKDNLCTEVRLAETLKISRRTLQMVKAARITPTPDTRKKLDVFLAENSKAPALSAQ